VTKSLGTLFGGTFVVWAVAVLLARFLGGERAAVYCSAAFFICLLPALFTLAWACQTIKHRPSQSFAVVASGTGVRMAFVLGAGLCLNQAVPYFEHLSFWCWIVGFYMVTLTLETLLVRRLKPAGSM
jgi:hypothetical protein